MLKINIYIYIYLFIYVCIHIYIYHINTYMVIPIGDTYMNLY